MTMALKPFTIGHIKTLGLSSSWSFFFVWNTGHLDDAFTTIFNGYIATCNF